MSLIRKHGAVLQAWACLALVSCDVMNIIGDIAVVIILLWLYQSLDVISIGIVYGAMMSL